MAIKKIIIILIFLKSLYADESLYYDYSATPKSKNIAERIGMEFSYDYMQTNGIDAKERFGFDEDITSIGTSMNLSYLLWEPNYSFDLSASINWSYNEPYYMGMTYYGFIGRYHLNRNSALRFTYAYATQGTIGGNKNDIELGTGNLWGIGYEYKLNNIYRFFFDYKKASLEGVSFIGDNSWVEEYTNYDVNMFSVGLGANFSFEEKNINRLKNNGTIEDMSISVGYTKDSTHLVIKDGTYKLNYATKDSTHVPITIESKSNFLNKSETLGYKLFSFGFDLFDYNQKAGYYYLRNVPEEVVGHYIHLTPSIFYTNSFKYRNIDSNWKIGASAGAGLLTLDAKNLNNLDVKNKLGIYTSLNAEIDFNSFNIKNLMTFKYSHIKQKYNNHGIKYSFDIDSIGFYINFKFKDIFSKDW